MDPWFAGGWRREVLRLATLVGAGFIMALPAIALGFPVLAHDADINVLRASVFADQLWGGDPYPRWLAAMNAGLGSPTFFFYPPVAFYVASLFRHLVPEDPYGWRQVGLAAALALIGSGLTCYVWLRSIAGPAAALAAAILYMAAPYHLAVDLYARGALAELWAFVWMPLILHGVRGLSRARSPAFPGLALGFALLVMSHPPAVLIFLLVPILHALLRSEGRRRLSVLSAALAAVILGAGLSAIYWMPAVMTLPYASFQGMDTGNLHYANRFLFTRLLEWSDFDTKVSWATLDTAVLAGCGAFVAGRFGQGPNKREAGFWLGVAILSIFMTTPMSRAFWQAIPLLPKLQFPFRFNLLLTLAMAALVALCFAEIPRPCPRRVRLLLAIIILAAAVWVPATAWTVWRKYPGTRTDPHRLASIKERLELRIEGDECRPRWAMPLRAKNLAPFMDNRRGPARGYNRAVYLSGTGRLFIRQWMPGDILIEVESEQGGRLGVSQFYYPGWKARLVGPDRLVNLEPSVPEGLLNLELPRARDHLQLRLEPGNPERYGLIISAASIAMLLLLSACLRPPGFSRPG